MVGGTIVRAAPQKPKGGGIGGFLKILVGLVVLVAAAGAGVYMYGRGLYTSPGPATENGAARTVLIAQGSSVPDIARELKTAGAIKDEFQFRMIVRAVEATWRPPAPAPGAQPAKFSLKAGEYEIPSAASLEQIIDRMAKGDVVEHTVVIPEGLTIAAIFRQLEGESVLSGDLPEPPAEGSLLPGGYVVQRGEARAALIRRMAAAQTKLLDELWEGRAPGIWVQTREQAVNLASVVERETGQVASERPMVAAAFNTRLQRGIPLQADATSLYGRNRGANTGRPMTAAELRVETPYDTYNNGGLPPTPICNPGRAAIEAVLHPADSRAIYFVADGVTGGHKFAETLEEHNRNVAALARLRADQARAARLNPAPPAAAGPAPAPAPAPSPSASPSQAATPATRPTTAPVVRPTVTPVAPAVRPTATPASSPTTAAATPAPSSTPRSAPSVAPAPRATQATPAAASPVPRATTVSPAPRATTASPTPRPTATTPALSGATQAPATTRPSPNTTPPAGGP